MENFRKRGNVFSENATDKKSIFKKKKRENL